MKPVEIEFLIKGKGGLADAGASLDNLRDKLLALIKESESAKKKLSEAGNTDDFDGAIAAAEEYREALRRIQATASAAFSAQKTQLEVLKLALADIDKKKTQAGIDGDTKAVEELEKRYQELKKQIADAEAALRIYSRANSEATEGIGRTQEAIDRCKDKMAQLQNESQKTKAETDNLGNSFKGSKQKADEYSGSLDDVIGHAKDIPGPVGDAATSLGHLTKATLRFLATPLGAVLAAISAALAMVASWFKRTEEGQNALAVGSAYFTQVLDSLLDVVDNVGEWLYKAFTKPKSAIKDLADFARDQLLNRLKAIGEVAKGVLDMLSGDISGGYKRVVNGWMQGVTGIKDVSGKVGGWMAETNKKANERMAITRRQNELDRQERDNLVERAKAEAEISKLREKAYDQTLSAKERTKALNDASEKTKAMYEKEIALAKEHYAVIKDTNALSHSNKEDKKKEAEAEARIYQLQAQRESALTSLRRQSNRTESSGTSASKQTAELAAKQIEEERRWQEDIAKARQAALDARRDAEIAAIKNDGERERAEQDEQHTRRLRQIKEQADDMKRAVYEHNKKIWEDTHTGSPYELTEEGKKGLGGIQLSADQSETISAQLDKENAEYQRLILQRYRDEVQAMRDYLKEYGTLEQQKLAITKEYEEKIGRETDEWRKKALDAEKKAKLNNIDVEVLRRDIDWTMLFDGFSDVFQSEIKKTVDNIEAYMRTDAFKEKSAEEKREYVNLRNQLSDKTGSDVGVFNFSIYSQIGEQLQEYQNALREAKEAEERHNAASNELFLARNALTKAENKLKTATDKEAAQKDYDRANERYKMAGRDEMTARANLDKSNGKVITAQANLQKSTTDAKEAIDDFRNAISQLTSGTLKGFADGLINLINAIKGNGLNNGLAGIGSLFKKNVEDAAGEIGDNTKEAAKKISSGLSEVDGIDDYIKLSINNFESSSNDAMSKGANAAKNIGTVASELGKIVSDVPDIYGQLIGAILSILDSLGDDPGKFIDDLLTSIFSAIDGILEQLGNGELAYKVVASVIKGVMGLVEQILEKLTFGLLSFDFFGKSNHEEMVEYQNQLTKAISSTTKALDKMTDELERAHGALAMQYGDDAAGLIRKNMESIRLGIDSVLSDNYDGGHSDYYHLNKNQDLLRQIQGYAKKNGATALETNSYNGYTWQKLMSNDSESLARMFKEIRDSGDDLWRQITQESGYNEGALEEWIEKLIDTYDQLEDMEKKVAEQLTTTTKENVFDDFLDKLYNMGNGARDVFENIADDFQDMVNKMVINNQVGENFREKMGDWYDKLAEYNRMRINGDIDNTAFQKKLQELKEEYEEHAREAQDEIEQLRTMGIIKATEPGSGQSAKVGGFTAMSQDQGTKLDGMFTAGLQHWSSMDRELGNVSDRLGSALDRLKKIEENTSYCKRLDDIADDIKSIKNNGIKVK